MLKHRISRSPTYNILHKTLVSLQPCTGSSVSLPPLQCIRRDKATHFYLLHICGSCIQVPILHSDVAFNLLYDQDVPAELMSTIPLVLAPYPRGLLTGKRAGSRTPASRLWCGKRAGNRTPASTLSTLLPALIEHKYKVELADVGDAYAQDDYPFYNRGFRYTKVPHCPVGITLQYLLHLARTTNGHRHAS